VSDRPRRRRAAPPPPHRPTAAAPPHRRAAPPPRRPTAAPPHRRRPGWLGQALLPRALPAASPRPHWSTERRRRVRMASPASTTAVAAPPSAPRLAREDGSGFSEGGSGLGEAEGLPRLSGAMGVGRDERPWGRRRWTALLRRRRTALLQPMGCICLERLDASPTLGCGHSFHSSMQAVLSGRRRCPTCRRAWTPSPRPTRSTTQTGRHLRRRPDVRRVQLAHRGLCLVRRGTAFPAVARAVATRNAVARAVAQRRRTRRRARRARGAPARA
jgi:hypothetical protein